MGANTNTGWGTTRTLATGSTETQFLAVGINIVRVFYDGSVIKYQWSQDEGTSWGTAVTVDSTAGDNDVMLNTNLAYDQITGRLHFLYGRNIDDASNVPVLCHRYTDNPFNASPTFSAEHIIDPGTGYGNNRFYRVAQSAFNGRVTVHHTQESASTFTTDGKIWRISSSDGGASWGSPTSVFASTPLVGPYEPNCAVEADGTILLTWYDDAVNNNQGGDIYTAMSSDGGVNWSSVGTKRTTTTDYGRPRPAADAGRLWIIANKPWPVGSGSDVYSFHSNDNGATWSSPVLRGTHVGSGNTSHPDIIVVNQFIGMIWGDGGTNPQTRQFIYSADGGSTFSSPSNVLTVTAGANFDAPRLVATTNRLVAFGYDDTVPTVVYNTNPFFALLPKVQNSAGITNFPEGSGTVLNTGSWTITNLGGEALKANGSNGAVRQTAAGGFSRAGSYRNDATYTGNVEVWGTITALSGGGETDIFIWDPVAKSGYHAASISGDFGNSHGVGRYATGSLTDFGNDAVATVANDVHALQVIGSYVIGWKLASSVWTELLGFRTLDTTYRASLKLELEIAGLTSAGHTVGSFGGGSLVVPVISVAPVATGTVAVGQVLSSTDGTWTGGVGRFSYQWQSSPDGSVWSNVSNAKLPLYTVVDPTKSYRCQVTATNSVGDSTSSPSNSVVGGVTISGSLIQGAVLTCSIAGASAYRWQRASDGSGTGNADIVGANAQTYTLQAADVGQYIRVGVTP